MFSRKGRLVLTDEQTKRKSREGRPSDTARLYGDLRVVSACSKLTLKTVKGSPIPPSSNAPGDSASAK